MGKSNKMIMMSILVVVGIMYIFQMTSENSTCRDALGCVKIQSGDPIKLGLIRPPNSQQKDLNSEQLNVIKLALADRGDNIYEHPITLSIKEIDCSESEGKKAVVELASESSILAIISTACPLATASAAKQATHEGFVMISGTDKSPKISNVSENANIQSAYFRTIFNSAEKGKAGANFAVRKLGKVRSAVIYSESPDQAIVAEVFSKAFKDFGGTVALQTELQKDRSNLQMILNSVSRVKPDFLFVVTSSDEGSHILQGINSNRSLTDLIVLGTKDLISKGLFKSVDPIAHELFFVEEDSYEIGGKNERLVSDYRKRYGVAPKFSYYGHVYDAVTLLYLTVRAATVPGKERKLTFRRQRLRDILHQTKDFIGITGSLTCKPDGDCGVVRFRILRVESPTQGTAGLKKKVVYIYASN